MSRKRALNEIVREEGNDKDNNSKKRCTEAVKSMDFNDEKSDSSDGTQTSTTKTKTGTVS